MKILQTVTETQAFSEALRAQGQRVALVPTMGALHEGHLSLVRIARQHADVVIVSIFVNPTQFGPHEDFDRYPRTLEADLAALAPLGVEAIFTPSVQEMYPPHDQTWVSVKVLDEHLCGPFRPDHFRGVTTVVARLFLICKPHIAVFGLKDAQQFFILRRMTKDLHFGIEMIGAETMRDPDGMAMSSRNRYLSPAERSAALVVSQAVFAARDLVLSGERQTSVLEAAMKRILASEPTAVLQYAQVVETETLQPVAVLESGQEMVAAVAVYFGKTRLIDNQIVRVP